MLEHLRSNKRRWYAHSGRKAGDTILVLAIEYRVVWKSHVGEGRTRLYHKVFSKNVFKTRRNAGKRIVLKCTRTRIFIIIICKDKIKDGLFRCQIFK